MNQTDLPNNWQPVRLVDAYQFTQKPKGLQFSAFENVPFVPMDFIPIGSTIFERFILKRPEDISSGVYFEPGDLLLAKITPSFENGKQGIIESLPLSFGIASTEIIPIQSVMGISDRDFLFYYLLRSNIRAELAGKMEGTTGRQRLSKSTLENLIIPLPPLPEQRAIAHALRAVQDAKEARQRELELERERKAALMEHLFTHGARGEARKQTEIGEMPESWQVVKLGTHVEKPAYGYTASATSKPVGPKFLRITDIQETGVDWDSVPYCSCAEDKEGQYVLKEDDLVIARIGATTGKAYLINGCPESVFASYLIRLRTKPSLLARYLSMFLQTRNYWTQINQNKGGRLKGGVNIPVLQSLRLPLPPLDEQVTISEVLGACAEKQISLQREIALLEELFRAMLEELMTGRLSALPLIEGD